MTEQSDIHIHFSDGAIMGLDYFEAVLGSPFSDACIKVLFETVKPNLLYQLRSSSFFTLKITRTYYIDFIEKDNDVLFELLLTNLRPLDVFFQNKEVGKTPANYGFDKMAVFYKGIKEVQMYFRYPAGLTGEQEKSAWKTMISIIRSHETGDEKQAEWLQSVMSQKDGLRYFQLDPQTWGWNLLDPLDWKSQASRFPFPSAL